MGLLKPNIDRLCEKRDIKGLIRALQDKDWDIRTRAAEALGELKEPAAVKALIRALEDEDSSVRQEAAFALGEIGDSQAVEPLMDAYRQGEKHLRWATTTALGKIGDSRAASLLSSALHDQDPDVRKRAAEALGLFRDVRAIEVLASALNDKDSEVRLAAINALGNIGSDEAVDYLLTLLVDSKPEIRTATMKAIGSLGGTRAEGALHAAQKIHRANQEKEFIDNIPEVISRLHMVTLIEEKQMGAPGPGHAWFQKGLGKLHEEDYEYAEMCFNNAIDTGLDGLRQGYAYAMLGGIRLNALDLNGAILNFLKVFSERRILYTSADIASRYLHVIFSEMGLSNEARAFEALTYRTSVKSDHFLHPAAAEKTRQIVRSRLGPIN